MSLIGRPRLHSLDLFTKSLLSTLGLLPLAACNTVLLDVLEGGAGGATVTGPSSTQKATSANASSTKANSVQTTAQQASTQVTSSTGIPMGHCVNPTPVLVQGVDTGFDRCAAGNLRRRAAMECPSVEPNPMDCCGGCAPGYVCNMAGRIACTCKPACKTDSDCLATELCVCSDAGGLCQEAGCRLPTDCAPGQECTSWDPSNGCLYVAFACTTPADTCGGDGDCDMTMGLRTCNVQPDGHRECGPGGCAIGRPFLVENSVRRAAVCRRADWCDDSPNGLLAPTSLAALSDADRAALASAWEHTAQMEHASVAAFARFALQLLALGAPADLVVRTQRAMGDEIEHAKLAFGLASAYLGYRVGPSELRIDGALSDNDTAQIIRLVVREGCIGETVAALEASELEAACEDLVPRRVLAQIAQEETEHAELAWLTLKWAIAQYGAPILTVLEEELSQLEAELARPQPALEAEDYRLAKLGMATNSTRQHYRSCALSQSIVPCLRALLQQRMPDAA